MFSLRLPYVLRTFAFDTQASSSLCLDRPHANLISFVILFRMDTVKKILRMAALTLCVILCFGCDEGQRNHDGDAGPSPASTGVLRVGVSVKDVTPSQSQIESGEIHMGGYGYLGIRDFGLPLILSKATGVHDRLFVRAILIELDGSTGGRDRQTPSRSPRPPA